jgi:hypothetical protein
MSKAEGRKIYLFSTFLNLFDAVHFGQTVLLFKENFHSVNHTSEPVLK